MLSKIIKKIINPIKKIIESEIVYILNNSDTNVSELYNT